MGEMFLSRYPNWWGFCPTVLFTRYDYVNFVGYPYSIASVPLFVVPMYFQSEMSMICRLVLLSNSFSGSMAHVTFCNALMLKTQSSWRWTPTTQSALFIEFIWRVLVTRRAASYVYGLFGWTVSVAGDTIGISKEFPWISLLQTSPQRSGLLSFVDLAGSERGRAKERHRCRCKQVVWEPP